MADTRAEAERAFDLILFTGNSLLDCQLELSLINGIQPSAI